MPWRFHVISIVLLALCAQALASSDPAGIEFFESKIRPVFVERCYKCHSAGAEKIEASFRLDSAEAILAGGESGKAAVVPGHPETSQLIHAIQYGDEDLQMPPKSKLPADQIASIEAWVKMGAPYPKSVATAATKPTGTAMTLADGRNFWSFKKPADQSVPVVKSTWARGDIDHFILAKLDEKKLTPSPEADRRTLIRRATFDLIGMPPTAEEIEAFEADKSADAYEKLIDRLLASPHYGERWGRYWLDVARYADTKGYVFEEERRYAYSFTYRDWVVRAFNEDLPYDQFLVQQIAADRLELGEDKRPLAALGFLTLGRRFLNNPPDIIDDRIDVVARGMMGLTVGCARCHDHKFDPIPTADYYSLYGVFASSHEPAVLPKIGKAENTPAGAEYEKELMRLIAERDAWKTARCDEIIKEAKAKDPKSTLDRAGAEALFNVPDAQKLRELQRGIDALPTTHPGAPPCAMAMEDLPAPVTPRIFKRGNAGNPGDEVPRRFLAILSPEDRKPFAQGSGRLELARAIASKDNPLTARVMVNRVWQHHFGAGLVRTPSDFGTRGERPTHPELLDYLARKFMDEDAWSIKKLHRQIMLSAAYRQSSSGNSREAAEIDPENRLLWHMNPRRLDFEAMRDSLLTVAGKIDLTIGGRSIDILAEPFSARRTIYGFIDRQNLPGTFRTFDFASPDMTQAQRLETSVPQQALFMMNSPFVLQQAKSIANRSGAVASATPSQRIQATYRAILRRNPDPDELHLAAQFIRREESLSDPTTRPVEKPSAWSYGFGQVDDATGHLKKFHKLPFFTGANWQGGPELPDPSTGWAALNNGGGHPGDLAHAVVRRWTAPRDCDVAISGTLQHPDPNGDGVRARLITTRDGTLATWMVHARQAETKMSPLHVKQGETIDFVVDCGPGNNFDFDSFGWKVLITKVAAEGALAGDDAGNTWDAMKEFSGSTPKPIPLNPWEKFAQVLLESNEFMFVD
jgi:hypothetical protein